MLTAEVKRAVLPVPHSEARNYGTTKPQWSQQLAAAIFSPFLIPSQVWVACVLTIFEKEEEKNQNKQQNPNFGPSSPWLLFAGLLWMRCLHTANLFFSVVIFEDTETAGHFSSNREESVQRHGRDSRAQGGGGVGLLQDKVTKDSGEKPCQDDPTCQSPTDKKAIITLRAWGLFSTCYVPLGLLDSNPWSAWNGSPACALKVTQALEHQC